MNQYYILICIDLYFKIKLMVKHLIIKGNYYLVYYFTQEIMSHIMEAILINFKKNQIMHLIILQIES